MAQAAYAIQPTARPVITVMSHGEHAFSVDLFARFIDYIDRKDSTVKGYVSCIRQFAKWLQANGIEQPKREHIKAYRDHLAASDLKASTQAQYLRAVRQFFGWTAAEGIYPNVADNIHGAKVSREHKRDNMTREGMAELAASIDRTTEQGKRLYAMVMLCEGAGARTIELHRANVGDLTKKAGRTYIRLWRKGHDEADCEKPLPEITAAAIWDYLDARTEPVTPKSPLFTSTSNNAGKDAKGKPTKRIAVTTISTMIKGAMRAAGYDDERLTPHSLRHGFITSGHEAGLPVYDLQLLADHQNPATTEVYIHESNRQGIETRAVDLIADYIFNGTKATPILPELRAAIEAMSLDEQRQLLETIEKGGE